MVFKKKEIVLEEGTQEIEVPFYHTFLDFIFEDGSLILWVLVNPKAADEKVKLQIFKNCENKSVTLTYLNHIKSILHEGDTYHIFRKV